MGQGALTALAQIAADGLGLDARSARVALRARPIFPMPASRAAPATRRRPASAIHNAGGNVDRAAGRARHQRSASPLFGAGNAGVIARGGRLSAGTTQAAAKATPTFSPAPDSRRSKAAARAPPIRRRSRTICDARAWRSLRRSQGRSRSRADARDTPGRRLRGGADHQSAAGASQLYGGMIWGVSFALHEEASLIGARPIR